LQGLTPFQQGHANWLYLCLCPVRQQLAGGLPWSRDVLFDGLRVSMVKEAWASLPPQETPAQLALPALVRQRPPLDYSSLSTQAGRFAQHALARAGGVLAALLERGAAGVGLQPKRSSIALLGNDSPGAGWLLPCAVVDWVERQVFVTLACMRTCSRDLDPDRWLPELPDDLLRIVLARALSVDLVPALLPLSAAHRAVASVVPGVELYMGRAEGSQ